MSSAAPSNHRWIHGPVSDLLIGCGGLYAIGFFALFVTYGDAVGRSLALLLPLGVLWVSLPHYGATLVRVYESREQIRRYSVFTIWATALLAAWFAVGTWNTVLGSIMITLYLSWSPWHYSGQNYGIALMFLGRAGVSIEPRAKTALWWSFVLSYLVPLLHMHGSSAGLFYLRNVGDTNLGLLPLGIPESVSMPLFALVLAGYLVSLLYAVVSLLRIASPRALLPAAVVVASQALWIAVPYAGVRVAAWTGDGSQAGFLQAAILWVAIAHAAQYLWITSYYARSSGGWQGGARYYARIFLFSSVVWTVPVVVFGSFALGGATYAQGLALLLTALVNLHHFVLDGAIWKLRNSRIASILIRDRVETGPEPIGPRGFGMRFGGHVVAAVAVACALVQITSYLGGEIVLPVAIERGNARVANMVMDASEWVGVGGAKAWVSVGEIELDGGDRASAARAFERAIASSDEAVRAHFLLGRMLVEDGELERGIVHLRRAVEIQPAFERARRELERAERRSDQLRSASRSH